MRRALTKLFRERVETETIGPRVNVIIITIIVILCAFLLIRLKLLVMAMFIIVTFVMTYFSDKLSLIAVGLPHVTSTKE